MPSSANAWRMIAWPGASSPSSVGRFDEPAKQLEHGRLLGGDRREDLGVHAG
jgi:hypothetical protein